MFSGITDSGVNKSDCKSSWEKPRGEKWSNLVTLLHIIPYGITPEVLYTIQFKLYDHS